MLSGILSNASTLATELDDFRTLAEYATIDANRGAYLSSTNFVEFMDDRVDEQTEVAKLRTIANRNQGDLQRAAQLLADATPLLYRVYFSLEAENLQALPLQLLSQVFANAQLRRDLALYEANAQQAAALLHRWALERANQSGPQMVTHASINGSEIHVHSQTNGSLKDCLVKIEFSDFLENSSEVYLYTPDWVLSTPLEIWSGLRHSFTEVTDFSVSIATPSATYESSRFVLTDRIESACQAVCERAEALVEDDQFDQAVAVCNNLRSISTRRGISKFDARINAVIEESIAGKQLIPERTRWCNSLATHSTYRGVFRPKYSPQIRINAEITSIDKESGDVRFAFHLGRGNVVTAVGKVDINVDSERVTLHLTKAARNAPTVDSLELRILQSGALRGTDSEGGRLELNPIKN